jgi:hypothetical protein
VPVIFQTLLVMFSTEWVGQAKDHGKLVSVVPKTRLVTFCRTNTNLELNPHPSQNADYLTRSIHASKPYHELIFDIRAMNES